MTLKELKENLCQNCKHWRENWMGDGFGNRKFYDGQLWWHESRCKDSLQPMTSTGEECPYFEEKLDSV